MALPLHPVPLNVLFAWQRGLATSRQAQALGLSRAAAARRERAGQLERPFPTVLRLTAAPRRGSRTAGGSARHLQPGRRLPSQRGRPPPSRRLPAGRHRAQRVRPRRVDLPGVVVHHVHELDPSDLIAIVGIRCTSLARTLCDLGSVVPPAVVERAFDDAATSERQPAMAAADRNPAPPSRPVRDRRAPATARCGRARRRPCAARGSRSWSRTACARRSSRRSSVSMRCTTRWSAGRDPRPRLPLDPPRCRGAQPAVPLRTGGGAGRRGPRSPPGPLRVGGPLRGLAADSPAGRGAGARDRHRPPPPAAAR